MNKNTHRLVYSRLLGMVVAVAETATAEGKSATGEARARRHSSKSGARAVVAGVAALGTLPTLSDAQIVPTPGTPTQVIQSPNGLPQVNVAKPSGAGVSVNTYNQFDVSRAGAILNNSATMVQTQQAGWINGNPNYDAGQASRIIVNQVNSPNPSQIRGALEIAGARAELVLANPSGIFLDGAAFINTNRATLTTGVPFYGADGSLAGYNVNRGLLTVAGAGLNASNIDGVDLIARAVQVNAAVYAKNLNVIAGANQVNHATLTATPIAGDGPAPSVAIDVSQLGGMYSDRIFLASNEFGVGVANAGTGDVTNSGHIVSDVATTVIGNNIVNRGVIGSGGTTAVAAVQDVRNVSGRIGGTDSITITDKSNQKQGVATLNRDTTNLNGTVDKTPDLQNVLNNQSDLINAATAASEAIAKQIGNYTDRKEREARGAAKNETDPTLKAQYLQDAKNWAEGGDNRVALHIAGGALTGGLTAGGLGAAGGAAGAGLSAKLAPELTEIAQSITGGGMIAFGVSDMAEGADGLYNRYNGINSQGVNPLRWGFNKLSPTWGDLVYDGANLFFTIGALRANVPLKMGTADGLNRPGSMFGVTVPRINNNTLIPFIGQAAPYGTTQGMLLFGAGEKGLSVINDVRQTESGN